MESEQKKEQRTIITRAKIIIRTSLNKFKARNSQQNINFINWYAKWGEICETRKKIQFINKIYLVQFIHSFSHSMQCLVDVFKLNYLLKAFIQMMPFHFGSYLDRAIIFLFFHFVSPIFASWCTQIYLIIDNFFLLVPLVIPSNWLQTTSVRWVTDGHLNSIKMKNYETMWKVKHILCRLIVFIY
jgi:hypothetical protein